MSPLHLLRLPLLPLQHIIQTWNIYEICQFAKVSKRTKNLVKLAVKKTAYIILNNLENFQIETTISESGSMSLWDTWLFKMKDVSESDNTESEAYNENNRTHTFTLVSENPLLRFLETLKFLFEVFDCSIHSVYWNSWNSEDMRQVIDWMNGCDKLTKVENVRFCLNVNNQMTLALFLGTFQKKLGRLFLHGDVPPQGNTDLTPLNFSIEMERFSNFGSARWVNLPILMSMNTCKSVDLGVSLLTNQDLNVFLRSWKEGRSNSILEDLNAAVPGQEDWKTVLNGLRAVVRHPTQVTRCLKQYHWYYGGVDIQRVDGKIGTVMWTHYFGKNEHEEIPKNIIEVFEKTKQEWVGTDSDVVFEERGNEIEVSDEEEIIEQHLPENCFNFTFVVWK
ncbi:hypothetical protein CRE_13982 [Caenorhabditis remanei]|uniref:F-box domain-containing protein n=1 Tax=Caenorhabditis remanei TaxID=31234 RepID=E3M8N1_CAERE|nr:hypothetical protein CRE_13982 [Caenorhabditis remanei]